MPLILRSRATSSGSQLLRPSRGPATDTAIGSPVRAASAVPGHSSGGCHTHAVGADAGRAVGSIRTNSTNTVAILTADHTARDDQEPRTATQTIGTDPGVYSGAIKIAPGPVVASMRLFRFSASLWSDTGSGPHCVDTLRLRRGRNLWFCPSGRNEVERAVDR
jgi:hypothetical protein